MKRNINDSAMEIRVGKGKVREKWNVKNYDK
jgi:hypothetical protein